MPLVTQPKHTYKERQMHWLEMAALMLQSLRPIHVLDEVGPVFRLEHLPVWYISAKASREKNAFLDKFTTKYTRYSEHGNNFVYESVIADGQTIVGSD